MTAPQYEVASAIEAFIRRQFRIIEGDAAFSRDAHLFEGGYVDSAGVVELLMFVESTYGVTLDDEQIFSDQFTTINGITGILTPSRTVRDELGAPLR
jgi:acyl carrier protein